MWDSLLKEQVKQMCATCIHGGRIVGYEGKGKNRKMLLSCEVFKSAVAQDFICDSYEDLKGHALYKLPVKE